MPLFRRNKVLCSIGAGPHRELLELARPGFSAFAVRHGYDLALETELLDPSRPASWSKVLLVQRLMRSHRAVLWVDSDAMIVDPSKDILDELPRSAMLGLVAHKTIEGEQIPNLGVFAVRSSRRARAFFDLVWRRTAFLHHKWWENGAALELFGYTTEPPVTLVAPSPWLRLVHFVDGRWNSLSIHPVPNPAIVHFAGQTHETRLVEMRRLAAGPAP